MADAPTPAPPTQEEALAWIRAFPGHTLITTLGIEVTAAEPGRVVATMPVDPRVHQPFGLLHGGASVALAETVASIAASLNIDRARYMAVGLEINANHVRAIRAGTVTANVASRLAESRYRNGAASYFEVIDAQRSSLAAQRAERQSAGQRAIASVALIRALGGGFAVGERRASGPDEHLAAAR